MPYHATAGYLRSFSPPTDVGARPTGCSRHAGANDEGDHMPAPKFSDGWRSTRPPLHRSSTEAPGLQYQEPYGEFLCGRALEELHGLGAGGDPGDGVIAHYDAERPSSKTPYGAPAALPLEVLDSAFRPLRPPGLRPRWPSCRTACWCRIGTTWSLTSGSTASPAHRLHLPLQTNAHSLLLRVRHGLPEGGSAEGRSCNMTKLHSAAVLSQDKRVHLTWTSAAPRQRRRCAAEESGRLRRDPGGQHQRAAPAPGAGPGDAVSA